MRVSTMISLCISGEKAARMTVLYVSTNPGCFCVKKKFFSSPTLTKCFSFRFLQIPLLDHLLQIPMPDTPLTKILHEFRAYRPLPHRQFLAHVAATAASVGVRDFSVQDKETATLYLKVLDHVRSFRWRHWLFAREYIIRRTPHPTATGGSPIVTV
jgi:Indoleamine 2,3-dioxygenase